MLIVKPNQVWCADITYIRLSHGFVYLVAILDWYSRKVLTWELSTTADQYFVIHALVEAWRRYGDPLVFNTDQGSQFTCPGFIDPLQPPVYNQHGRQGAGSDSVAVERFWRSLKYEEVYRKDYIDLIEARKKIGSYISRYNEFRPHQSLAGRTPDSVRGRPT